jgi:hypothetical protein
MLRPPITVYFSPTPSAVSAPRPLQKKLRYAKATTSSCARCDALPSVVVGTILQHLVIDNARPINLALHWNADLPSYGSMLAEPYGQPNACHSYHQVSLWLHGQPKEQERTKFPRRLSRRGGVYPSSPDGSGWRRHFAPKDYLIVSVLFFRCHVHAGTITRYMRTKRVIL